MTEYLWVSQNYIRTILNLVFKISIIVKGARQNPTQARSRALVIKCLVILNETFQTFLCTRGFVSSKQFTLPRS